MKTKLYFFSLLLIFTLALSGCTMPFGQPNGPDSGEEIDTSIEPRGPDSGEDADNQGPDSGEEIDTSVERQTPDSGDDEDNQGPESGEDEDNRGPDSGEDIDTSQEPTGPDSGEEEYPGPDSGEELTLSEDLQIRAKASCNRIADASTCVEYIGSYWSEANARLNCGDNSAFLTKACPRPAIGGCNLGGGTSNEIVTWHYNYGGDPYNDEVKPYAIKSCSALPAGRWIN